MSKDAFAEDDRGAAVCSLDDAFAQAASHHDGLIVVSGSPGSGRSETAARILGLVTAQRQLHVVTLEAVSPDAARAALGEDPDVLHVTAEPDAAALQVLTAAADSGVLVITILAARSAVAAAGILARAYPESENTYGWRPQRIRAVFAERLVPGAAGSREAAYEVLIGSPAVRNLIRCGKFAELQSACYTPR